MICVKCNSEKPNGIIISDTFYCDDLCYKSPTFKLPTYGRIHQTAMRWVDGEYYRDAGCWSVDWQFVNGKLFTKSYDDNLNMIPIIEISKEEWQNDNRGYV